MPSCLLALCLYVLFLSVVIVRFDTRSIFNTTKYTLSISRFPLYMLSVIITSYCDWLNDSTRLYLSNLGVVPNLMVCQYGQGRYWHCSVTAKKYGACTYYYRCGHRGCRGLPHSLPFLRFLSLRRMDDITLFRRRVLLEFYGRGGFFDFGYF